MSELTFRRPPDVIIGGQDDPYLRRWWVLPRNRWFNIYLHHFLRSDDDRALHDHPWINLSILICGEYLEHLENGAVVRRRPWRPWAFWRIVALRAVAAHRIELLREWTGHPKGEVRERPVWTLFVTGPNIRQWGFLCPKGWRHWQAFTNPADGGATVGRGCDD